MTAPKPTERPILFNTEMVRAVLDGRKTQTRRVVKPQPTEDFSEPRWLPGPGHSGEGWYCAEAEYPDEGSLHYRCPYGVHGDRLWVRETFYCDDYRYPDGNRDDLLEAMEYRADHDCRNWEAGCPCNAEGRSHWLPSVHMPRWASRIDLEVTGVRVERVQDVTADDCLGEGIDVSDLATGYAGGDPATRWALRERFRNLWDSINAKRGHGWESNPWVWVVELALIAALLAPGCGDNIPAPADPVPDAGPPVAECVAYADIEAECPGLTAVIEQGEGHLVCDLGDPSTGVWELDAPGCWVAR